MPVVSIGGPEMLIIHIRRLKEPGKITHKFGNSLAPHESTGRFLRGGALRAIWFDMIRIASVHHAHTPSYSELESSIVVIGRLLILTLPYTAGWSPGGQHNPCEN